MAFDLMIAMKIFHTLDVEKIMMKMIFLYII